VNQAYAEGYVQKPHRHDSLLQSLYLEACGDNAKLLEFHKQILEDDENNEAILKRQVRFGTFKLDSTRSCLSDINAGDHIACPYDQAGSDLSLTTAKKHQHPNMAACTCKTLLSAPTSWCMSEKCMWMYAGCAGLQVALEKSKGNLSGAIELLRKYVDIYMLDREAWEELRELYLQVISASCIHISICVAGCTNNLLQRVCLSVQSQPPS